VVVAILKIILKRKYYERNDSYWRNYSEKDG